MSRFLVGLALAPLAPLVAASFVIPGRQGELEERHPGGQRVPEGGKSVSGCASGAPASDGQTHEASVEVIVTGSPGLRFAGEVETPDGVRSIDGRVPETYPVTAGGFAPDLVTATVRKDAQEGTLRVEVMSGGRVAAGQETSAGDGLARVTWRSPQ